MTVVGMLCELETDEQQNVLTGYVFFFPNSFSDSVKKITSLGHFMEDK